MAHEYAFMKMTALVKLAIQRDVEIAALKARIALVERENAALAEAILNKLGLEPAVFRSALQHSGDPHG